MPTVPIYTKCRHLGCKQPRARYGDGYCIDHGGRDTYNCNSTEERKEFNSLYQTPFWRKTRIAHLSRQPLCQSCLSRGIVAPAAHVDHLFPWRGVGREAFFTNVFQSLCHGCHSDKTQLERQGICRAYSQDGHVDHKVGDYKAIVYKLART